MSRAAHSRVVAIAAIGLSVNACGSSPEPIYYAMSVVPGAAAAGWPRLIQLRRTSLPGYLDRAEIVGSVAGYRLRVASGDSWSEPLGDMVGRIVNGDLAARLPGSLVFGETSPISSDPDAIVSIDIQRFDRAADGVVTLVAAVSIERPPHHAPIASKSLELHTRTATTGTTELVAAMSSLLGQLSDAVAAYLRNDAPADRSTSRPTD